VTHLLSDLLPSIPFRKAAGLAAESDLQHGKICGRERGLRSSAAPWQKERGRDNKDADCSRKRKGGALNDAAARQRCRLCPSNVGLSLSFSLSMRPRIFQVNPRQE
jgi:hypothetical protein